MAIDVKAIIADAVLTLCRKKALNKITIADIQEVSGISRQTFYNHFRDKYDLIQYIYEHRVIAFFDDPASQQLDYYEATLTCLRCDAEYKTFMQQACRMSGPNCLADFMYNHSIHFDRTLHQSILGRPLTAEEQLISDYHSAAVVRLRIDWILNGLPCSPEDIMRAILQARLFSLNELLYPGGEGDGPYAKAAQRDPEIYAQWCHKEKRRGMPAHNGKSGSDSV